MRLHRIRYGLRKAEGSGPRNESLIFGGEAMKGDAERCLDIMRLGRAMSWKEGKEGKPRKA